MNDIYTWPNDLYPLVKKRFDLRYGNRMDVISNVAEVITQDEIDYRFEGIGGYGELPEYDGTSVASADQKRSFITTVSPKEHALKVTLSYKKAKVDLSGEAQKVGTRLADSAYMTVLNEFYRLFANAFTNIGSDGAAWASKNHPINSQADSGTYSNLINSALSVSAITSAQSKAAAFVTPDGLPFAGNFDLLLVSPDLEAKAKENVSQLLDKMAKVFPMIDKYKDIFERMNIVRSGGGSGSFGGGSGGGTRGEAYAYGGIVTQPTRALIGEAGYNEYVLPEREDYLSRLASLIGQYGGNNGGSTYVYLDGRLIQRQVSNKQNQVDFTRNR